MRVNAQKGYLFVAAGSKIFTKEKNYNLKGLPSPLCSKLMLGRGYRQ